MSHNDYTPAGQAYTQRWEQPDIEPEAVRAEISVHVEILTSDTITGPANMVRSTTEVDRASACKLLCACVRHPEALEQFKRQNMVATPKVMTALMFMILNGGDVTKHWGGMLLVQLLYRNAMAVSNFCKAGGIQVLSDVLELAESQRQATDRGEQNQWEGVTGAQGAAVRNKQKTRAEREAAGLEEEPVQQQTQLPLVQSVLNILAGDSGGEELWRLVVSTEKIVEVKGGRLNGGVAGINKGKGMAVQGLCAVLAAVCQRGRRLEVPLLVASVQICLALANIEGAVKYLLRASVSQSLYQHLGQGTVEGLAAAEIRSLLAQKAALMVQKHVRGHFGRNIFAGNEEDKKVEYLKGFAIRASWKFAMKGLKWNWKTQKKVRKFVAKFFGRKEVDEPKQLGLDALAIYRELVTKLTQNAEKKRTKSLVSRNYLFGLWLDYMETWVADLVAAVQKKCKRVLALMSNDAYQRAFVEWRDQGRKSKAVKRRWLHGATDRGWRAWREVMEQMYELHRQVQERCARVLAPLASNLQRLSFLEWAGLISKNKRAVARFLNATLSYGFNEWVCTVEDERNTREAVFEKCKKLLSMLATDGMTMAFVSWKRFAFFRVQSERMRKSLGRQALEAGWFAWVDIMNDIADLMQQCRERCSRTIAYMCGGFIIEYFKAWLKITTDTKRAMWKWKNGVLVTVWKVWTVEILPKARLLKKLRMRVHRRFEIMVFVIWREVANAERHRKSVVQKVVKRMQIIIFLIPFHGWMEYTSHSKRYRFIIGRFKRRFELRTCAWSVRGWSKITLEEREKRRRLHTLTVRINGRYMVLFISQLQDILEEKLRVIKSSLIASSNLINRWSKRPMYHCFEEWSELVVENARKAAMLKRLRFRIQNRYVVLTFSSWLDYIIIARADRHAVLARGIHNCISAGDLKELKMAMQWHPCAGKRYKRDGSQAVLTATIYGAVGESAKGARQFDQFRVLDGCFEDLEHAEAANRQQALARLATIIRSGLRSPLQIPPLQYRYTPASPNHNGLGSRYSLAAEKRGAGGVGRGRRGYWRRWQRQSRCS